MEYNVQKDSKIAVLCGGMSSEREVSLRSGKNILNALHRLGYKNAQIVDVSENVAEDLKGYEFAYNTLHGKYGEDGCIQGLLEILKIPYTATMAPMIAKISSTQGADFALPMWWCLSLGACLGGNMTIIGAAANVIVSETANANGHHIKFMEYLKYGVTITFLSLAISSVYIWFRFLAV